MLHSITHIPCRFVISYYKCFYHSDIHCLQIRNSPNSTTLEISLAFPEDSGTFTVVVTNCMGEAKASCNLLVREATPMDGDIDSCPPSIPQPLRSRESMEGSKVRMDCVVVGRPEPMVRILTPIIYCSQMYIITSVCLETPD